MPFSSSTTRLGVPFNNTITQVSPEQRNQATQGAWLTDVIQNLYSIILYDTQTDSTVVDGSLDPANRTNNAEYFFRVPPKVHEFDEPFSTSVIATQDGGKYVESYGSIIKAIRVSGTTGLRPNKSIGSSIPLLGITDQQINTLLGAGLNTQIRTIPADEKTGFDDIIFLRNIFRKYSDIKASDQLAGRVVMLWRNLKDADYWVVEPDDFKLAQNSQSPLTYDYSISFKTLSRFDFSYSLPPDPLEQVRSRYRMLARLQEYGQNILNIFLTVSTQINKALGFATFVTNTCLAPMLNIINGLNAVKTSAYGVVRGLRNQVTTLQGNLTEAISKLVAVVHIQDPVVRSLRRMQVVCARILSEPIATETSVNDVAALLNRYSAAYEQPGTTTTARRSPDASPSYIGHESATSTIGSDLVRPGEDIRDIAARVLGDRSRWRILVTLNRLRSPFISVTGGPGVLSPGESILFPSDRVDSRIGTANVVGTQNPSGAELEGQNVSLNTPVQQSYGRDLRLKSEFVGGSELTDVVLNQRGDLSSIQGVPNLEQALRIKFATERNELPAHPKFGAKFPIGRKATPASFNELRINTINTLMSDTRVENINELSFVTVGDILAVAAKVVVINSQDILDTSFALRRF